MVRTPDTLAMEEVTVLPRALLHLSKVTAVMEGREATTHRLPALPLLNRAMASLAVTVDTEATTVASIASMEPKVVTAAVTTDLHLQTNPLLLAWMPTVTLSPGQTTLPIMLGLVRLLLLDLRHLVMVLLRVTLSSTPTVLAAERLF